jgi:hypothetical protein
MKRISIALLLSLSLFALVAPHPFQRMTTVVAGTLARDAAHAVFKKLPR